MTPDDHAEVEAAKARGKEALALKAVARRFEQDKIAKLKARGFDVANFKFCPKLKGKGLLDLKASQTAAGRFRAQVGGGRALAPLESARIYICAEFRDAPCLLKGRGEVPTKRPRRRPERERERGQQGEEPRPIATAIAREAGQEKRRPGFGQGLRNLRTVSCCQGR